MSEGEHITRREFKYQINGVRTDVSDNKKSIDKLSLIIIGNGDVGLLEKVNILFLRNHWADKAVWVILTVIINMFSMYLTGALKL